jgi:hypothetical protein
MEFERRKIDERPKLRRRFQNVKVLKIPEETEN